MQGFGDLRRMVNRSDGTVRAVLVNGRVAFEEGTFDPALGRELAFGQFLPAAEKVGARSGIRARGAA